MGLGMDGWVDGCMDVSTSSGRCVAFFFHNLLSFPFLPFHFFPSLSFISLMAGFGVERVGAICIYFFLYFGRGRVLGVGCFFGLG